MKYLLELTNSRVQGFLRQERIRIRRSIHPDDRLKGIKRKSRRTYKWRQLKLLIRYSLFVLTIFVAFTQVLSVFVLEWINPLAVLLFLLQLMFSFAVMILIGIVGYHALIFSFHFVVGDGIQAASIKYRNSIYLITLVFFLLDQRSALGGLSALIPIETFQSSDDIHALILLVTTYFWVNYVISRLYDAERVVNEPSSDSAISIMISAVSFVFNTALPILLTAAMIERLDVDLGQDLIRFLYHILANISALDVPGIDDLIHRISAYLYVRFIGIGP